MLRYMKDEQVRKLVADGRNFWLEGQIGTQGRLYSVFYWNGKKPVKASISRTAYAWIVDLNLLVADIRELH